MKLNENTLAKAITLKEGKKISLPIGQVKEVLKITLEMLAQADLVDLAKLLAKHRK